MATNYEIYTTDAKKRFIVNEHSTNNETSVTMIGHGLPEYGVNQNTNFLHLLENFANTTPPKHPIIGQLWLKITERDGADPHYDLMYCKSTTGDVSKDWRRIAVSDTTPDIPPSPIGGEFWYDTTLHVLKVADSTVPGGWNIIGPEPKTQSHFEDFVTQVMSNGTTVYTLPLSLFQMDVVNKGDVEEPNGSLNFVTVKIMAKEIIKNILSDVRPRSCVWVYRFTVQSTKLGTGSYVTDIVGRENYELISKTEEDTDWTVDIFKQGSSIGIRVRDESGITGENSRIVVGFDTEIVRI